MAEVGIRELKTRTSEILRSVHEQGVVYVITQCSRPIATLSPLETREVRLCSGPMQSADAWRELEGLGEDISRAWKSERSSIEILSGTKR